LKRVETKMRMSGLTYKYDCKYMSKVIKMFSMVMVTLSVL